MNPQITNNSLLDPERIERLQFYAALTACIPGDVAEVGVYKGGSAYLLAETLAPGKTLYLFDTFTGLPAPGATDLHKEGDFAAAQSEVEALLAPFLPTGVVQIFPGLFPQETGPLVAQHQWSLVHLDVDLYSGVRDCLEFFAGRMSPGGFIVLDDVHAPSCPGALLAAEQWCKTAGSCLVAPCKSQGALRF